MTDQTFNRLDIEQTIGSLTLEQKVKLLGGKVSACDERPSRGSGNSLSTSRTSSHSANFSRQEYRASAARTAPTELEEGASSTGPPLAVSLAARDSLPASM